MDDYKDELEASFRRINEGDIISGTVIDVNEEEVTLDLKYYAQGIIKVADLSNDPDFNVMEQVHKGDRGNCGTDGRWCRKYRTFQKGSERYTRMG